jgi:hypothetical protein
MSRRATCLAVMVSVFLGVGAGQLAWADNPAINTDDFLPSPHARDILDVNTTRAAKHLQYSGGIWFTYRQSPLVVQGFLGEGEVELVGAQLVGNLQFAMPLFGRASVGVDLPTLLYTAGDEPSQVNPDWSQLSGAGLGDLRLSAKVRFWGDGKRGLGVGAAQELTLPTSVGDKLLGSDAPTSTTRLVVDYQCTGFVLALNGGYLVRKAATDFTPSVGDEVLMGAGLQIPLLRDVLQLLLTNQTRTLASDPFAATRATANSTRGGLRIRPFRNLVVTAAGAVGFGALAGSAAWEGMLQIAWEPRGSHEH